MKKSKNVEQWEAKSIKEKIEILEKIKSVYIEQNPDNNQIKKIQEQINKLKTKIK